MKDRYPKLKRGPDGKPLCRGCGGKVGKGRQSWCSAECYKRNCPQEVISAVKQRDKGICQICGVDTNRATAVWRNEMPDRPNYQVVHNVWPYDYSGYKLTPEYKAFSVALTTWKAACPKAEYDHIIPFCEGGPTSLDNMRTLCRSCHKKRTAEWRRSRNGKPQREYWGATVKDSLTVGGQAK